MTHTLKPLQSLLDAQRLHLAGHTEEANRALSQALGATEPLPLLTNKTARIFEEGPLRDVILHIALVETRSGEGVDNER